MVESQIEKRMMEMSALRARVYKAENLMALDQLRALVWGNSRKPFEITGALGVVDSTTQDFQIHSQSEVLSPDGYVFKTDNITYESANHLLTTEDDVEGRPIKQSRGSTLKVLGRGLLINLHKNTYEIKRNVRAEEKLSPSSSILIKSADVVIYPDAHSATFVRNVLVSSPQFEIKGGRLVIHFSANEEEGSAAHPEQMILDSPKAYGGKKVHADLKSLQVESKGLVVDFNPDGSLKKSEAIGNAEGITKDQVKLKAESLTQEVMSNNQSRVLLKGHVTINTKDRLAHCEEAEFYPDTGQIVLKHIASVNNGDQLLEGDLIRFSTQGSEIFVEKARGDMDRKSLKQ